MSEWYYTFTIFSISSNFTKVVGATAEPEPTPTGGTPCNTHADCKADERCKPTSPLSKVNECVPYCEYECDLETCSHECSTNGDCDDGDPLTTDNCNTALFGDSHGNRCNCFHYVFLNNSSGGSSGISSDKCSDPPCNGFENQAGCIDGFDDEGECCCQSSLALMCVPPLVPACVVPPKCTIP